MLPALSLSTLLLLETTAWAQAAPEDPSSQEDAQPEAPDPGEPAAAPDDAEEEPETAADTATDGAEPEEPSENEGADEQPSEVEPNADDDPPKIETTGAEADDDEAGDAPAVSEDEATTPVETSSDESRAQEPELAEAAWVPGSRRPAGLGLAPDAPHAGPAAGARAPSFGTPLGPEDASLVISGNLAAWLTAGIGRRPEDAGDDYGSPIIHTPPLIAGRAPFWRQGELSLFITYGTPMVNATINYNAFAGGREYEGYQNVVNGPQWGQAYITVSPNPFGKLRVRAIMGAFIENYAGPGQWGWGQFGPLIALRGYGETTHFEYNASSKLKLTAAAGIMGVPGIPEDFPRGNWNGWTETGVSTIAVHGHTGLNYAGKYSLRLHYAGARGTDERVYLAPESGARDGRMDVAAIEGHWYGVPWGHFGISGGYWDLEDAKSVHDAIWWGVKYSKGAQDILGTYLGNAGRGTGKMAAVSAEFNTSLARIAWHPRPFDGRSPDIRLTVAGMAHRTLETDDPAFEDSNGYLWATEVEYQMLRWFSFNFRAFGENRDWFGDRYGVYNAAPGIAFRSDWQSPDRIELWYSRHFYSDSVDNNPAAPLDRDLVALGIFIGF